MSALLNPLRRSFAIYRGLPRAAYVLFVAQVVNSLGHFVLPFLTLILTVRGGLDAAEAGRIVTIATMSFVPGSILGGRIADTFGRKRVVVVGFAIGIASFVIWGFIGDVAVLPWFVFVAEFSSGLIHNILMTLVYAQYTFALPLQMNAVLGDTGPVSYGLVITINALIVVFCTAPIVVATKRLRPVLCLALAALLYLVGMGSVYFVASAAMFVVTAVVWTAGEILSATNVDVYVANHTPTGRYGTFDAALVPNFQVCARSCSCHIRR